MKDSQAMAERSDIAGEGSARDGIDAATLEAASRGDEAAWKRIAGEYSRRVYGLLRSQGLGRDDAEELTQGVMVTVVSKVMGGAYQEQGQFEAWLFRIAINRARDLGRKRARRGTALEVRDSDAITTDGPTQAGTLDASGADQVQALRVAMDGLADADREIISLRHHAGLSFKQIAAELGTPLGTLLARHHRAIQKLKSVLMPEPNAEEASGASVGGIDHG